MHYWPLQILPCSKGVNTVITPTSVKMVEFDIFPQHLITSGKYGNQTTSESLSDITVKQSWCTVHVQILMAVFRAATTCSKAKITQIPSVNKGCISQCYTVSVFKILCIS